MFIFIKYYLKPSIRLYIYDFSLLKIAACGISICLLFASASFAGEDAPQSQNTAKEKLSWVNFGLGGSSIGLSVGVIFSQQLGSGLLSGRFIHNKEMKLNIFGTISPAESDWDVGMLYGLMGKAKYAMASISAGLSVVGGVHRGEFLYSSGSWFGTTDHYENNEFSTIGIPVEAQLLITPSASFGFGIYRFANLNAEESFTGGLICLQFGRLR